MAETLQRQIKVNSGGVLAKTRDGVAVYGGNQVSKTLPTVQEGRGKWGDLSCGGFPGCYSRSLDNVAA